MKRKSGSGWKGESRRHSLARKGVKTVLPDGRRFDVSKFVAQGKHNLYYSVVDAKPIDYDFSEHNWTEDWDIFYPDFYDMTKEELIEFMEELGYDIDSDLDKDELINKLDDNWLYENEIMMNYLYPLPNDYEPTLDDWRKLKGTIFVHVQDEDRWFLNLAGGGMDMSWEICESYINLGYYPPAHFCRLPRFAGKDYSNPRNKKIIECCIESLDTVSGWAKSNIKELEDMMKGD